MLALSGGPAYIVVVYQQHRHSLKGYKVYDSIMTLQRGISSNLVSFSMFHIFSQSGSSAKTEDNFRATSVGEMDAFVRRLGVWSSFEFHTNRGNLWAELYSEQAETRISVEIASGDAEIRFMSKMDDIRLCPFSGQHEQGCIFLEPSQLSSLETSNCNLNLTVEGNILVQSANESFATENLNLNAPNVQLHNETLEAIAEWAASPQGESYLSYAVLTSGTPRRTPYLKPSSALRLIVIPSESFIGADQSCTRDITVLYEPDVLRF